VKIRVYYEDTDAGGIVYHANYIKYCERARSEIFFSKGITPDDMSSGFVVAHLEADYLQAAKLGELLEVATHVIEIKKSYITLDQEIYKESKVIFRMKIKVAYVDDGKPTRIPKKIVNVLESMI